jgi:hypothetical protein
VSDLAWSRDGKALGFVAREPKSEDRKRREKEKDDAFSPTETYPGARLWVIDVASLEARQLSRGDLHVAGFSFSPDGQRIAVAGQPTPLVPDSYDSSRYFWWANTPCTASPTVMCDSTSRGPRIRWHRKLKSSLVKSRASFGAFMHTGFIAKTPHSRRWRVSLSGGQTMTTGDQTQRSRLFQPLRHRRLLFGNIFAKDEDAPGGSGPAEWGQGRVQISSAGGVNAKWSRVGREIPATAFARERRGPSSGSRREPNSIGMSRPTASASC